MGRSVIVPEGRFHSPLRAVREVRPPAAASGRLLGVLPLPSTLPPTLSDGFFFFFFSPRLLFVLEKPSHLPFISLSKALDWLRHDDKNWGGFSPLQQLHGQRNKYMHIVTH